MPPTTQLETRDGHHCPGPRARPRRGPSGRWRTPALAATLAGAVHLCGATGCVVRRHERNDEELASRREAIREEILAGREALSRNLVARMIHEQDAEAAGGEPAVLDVLILSGGGEYGAFGAGFLEGWAEIADPALARPHFDAVTGVSTGALIAPLAFVGTDEAYRLGYELYSNPKGDWFRERGLLTFLLRRESFTDNAGLRRDVQAAVSQEMIGQIADGAGENRVLLIGTTNVDMGMLVMWDAAMIASRVRAGERDADMLYDVLMASTAIPGIFPPVEIEGDLYVDGGVLRNIAYTTDQDYAGSAMSIWAREHADRPPPRMRLWVIINNPIASPEQNTGPDWPSLAARSLELSIRSSMLGSLDALSMAMRLMSATSPYQVEFRYVAVPDEWRPLAEGQFQKENMAALAQLGRRMGADPSSWRTHVPNPESPGADRETRPAHARHTPTTPGERR